VSINPQMMKLRKGVDVLVATPGRLLDLHRQNAVQFDQVQTLVLDEADRMLDLGFARELNAVFAALPAQRQTLLFSATFTDDIRAMAAGILRGPVNISVSPPNATASKIKQWVVPVDKKNKPDLFMHLVARTTGSTRWCSSKPAMAWITWRPCWMKRAIRSTPSTATNRNPRACVRWSASRRAKY
jgi:Superfamily II DNA and RNA helicases